jgi:hypothetical protein
MDEESRRRAPEMTRVRNIKIAIPHEIVSDSICIVIHVTKCARPRYTDNRDLR